ncbi:MAG: hypothetical protein IKA31_00030, partial [Clostridia bacterium]|nr:hypothetical protein [Clostridia bacterium]
MDFQNEKLEIAEQEIQNSKKYVIAIKSFIAGLMQGEDNNYKSPGQYGFSEKGEDIMPGIKLRNDGRYEIRKMENGKRVSLYAKTLKEAKVIFNKFKNNKILIEQKEETKKEYLLEEWTKIWMETYKKPFVKERSLKDINYSLNIVLQELGKFKLSQLKTLQIQKFLNNIKQGRTKERIQVYFNACLQKATDLDYISKNPFSAVEKSKRGKYKNYTYSFEEQEKILVAIKETSIEHEIYCYLLTGCRPSELPKKQNFNFDKKIVSIYGTKNESSKHREIQLSDN